MKKGLTDALLALRQRDREIEALKETIRELNGDLRVKECDLAALRKVRDELKEQLDIAKTEASDLTNFRERERRHAEAVFLGHSMAISAMVLALKGAK